MNARADFALAFAEWARARQADIEAALDRLLPTAQQVPGSLHAAMRYAVLGGGKRVRPLLAYAAGEAVGAAQDRVAGAAVAVEFIHCYSLIHDDLPCMDDDILRRGRPTTHVQFDEATALLAGDALQCLAFEVLADVALADGEMVRVLARSSGSVGMAGGGGGDPARAGGAA